MVRSTLAFSLLAAASAALAERPGRRPSNPGRPVVEKSNQVPGAYIVEFEDGASSTQFRTQADTGYDTRMTLDYELFKGISIQLNDVETAEERAAQLASLPAVKNIWPVKMIDRPNPINDRAPHEPSQPVKEGGRRAPRKRQQGGNETVPYQPHVMTGVDRLHAEGITGEGITIAVIDTGIDYNHPALGGCFGEGCLVAYGYDLVGDDYDGENAFPDSDPDDACDGHGTHVAGIIAAQGDNPEGFSGVAPGVTLAAYRVFGCNTWAGVSTDILISAFNMAYEQGADIITASIGGESGWSEEPWAVAVSRIVDRGVPCTLAAGNSGGGGLFLSSTAADGKGVTAIASFDNPHIIELRKEATYSVDSQSVAIPWAQSWPLGLDGVEREVWASSFDTENSRDACDPLPDDTPDLSDYYVLFRESWECYPMDQAINLAAKGARFLVMYSFDEELYAYDVEGFEGTENILGAAAIYQDTGRAMVTALADGATVRAVFENYDDAENFIIRRWNTLNPGAVSAFSSWGPTYELDFKPQFGAPGGDIFSTYPLELGTYAVLSGTSMACPFAAGAYALVSQARGIKPEPRLLETLFASTAQPQLFSRYQTPFDEWLAPGAQQGAGLIQVYDAAFTTTRLEPSSLAFNDTANFSGTMNFTIVNDGADDISLDISHIPTRTLYTVEEDEQTVTYGHGEVIPYGAELSFSQTKVTVSAGSAITIQVTATPPDGLNDRRYPYWSGFIAVNGTSTSLSLPYQGLSGSLREANVMPESEAYVAAYPDSLTPIPANTSFTVPAPGDDYDWENQPSFPLLLWRYEWGTKNASVHVVPATTSPLNSTYAIPGGFDAVGEVVSFSFMTRLGFQSFWWGDLANGDYVPAGRYKIVFVAQRLFTDGTSEDDWIVHASTPFQLNYADPRAK
ncbi:subtilisin-like serine protease PR1C [Stachybotrys elegans]|uniref:Subtilisin-like serine protease PR1C n=1 Tax=Stachybotrys elegans TaxID=80388 RepID=A0A8K0WUG4_9HYPO|nr:subtilisin-like serine protease PR1C [Stachybotrys elegans]